MRNVQFPTARKNGLVVQEIPDEVLVYDLDSNKAHCLNKTAGIVWKSCDGANSVSDIARLVTAELGEQVNDDFVWLAIDQLSENELLEQEIRSEQSGQSRREVLKKIGLASVVALPVIASLVAPTSIMAATCDCRTSTGNAGCLLSPCTGNTCNRTTGVCTTV